MKLVNRSASAPLCQQPTHSPVGSGSAPGKSAGGIFNDNRV